MASGDLADLRNWAMRTARLDTSDTTDQALATSAINDAYLSTCNTGDDWDFLQQEGQFTVTAGSDVYSYSSIATAMSITGASIDEILTLTNDDDGYPLESMGWAALEGWSHSSHDDEATGQPFYWSKWASRIRLFPSPDENYTFGAYVRLVPAEMTADSDTPLIPLAWRRRLLVPFAAARLLMTEGGLETIAEANRLMEQYRADFIEFRTAHATAKRPTFRLNAPSWEIRNTVDGFGLWSE